MANNKLAILVGGGPAPGINSVIAAATIRAALQGIDVIGVRDGFEWLMRGDMVGASLHQPFEPVADAEHFDPLNRRPNRRGGDDAVDAGGRAAADE